MQAETPYVRDVKRSCCYWLLYSWTGFCHLDITVDGKIRLVTVCVTILSRSNSHLFTGKFSLFTPGL